VSRAETPTAELAQTAAELSRATARLSMAEQRWRKVLELAPNGFVLLSPESRFELVNPAMCRIIGYPEETLLGMGAADITHPDDFGEELLLLQQLMAGRIERYTFEKRLITADGRTIWVQVAASLLRDDAGRPENILKMVEDVTERRLAAMRLAAIIARAGDAFIGTTMDGVVTEWNDAAEHLFGYRRTEVLGQPLGPLILPPHRQRLYLGEVRQLLHDRSDGSLGRPLEISALTRDRRNVKIELSLWRSPGSGGTSGGELYAFARDRTEATRMRRRQEAVVHAQQAIAEVELSAQKVMDAICAHAARLTGAGIVLVEIQEGPEMTCRACNEGPVTVNGVTLAGPDLVQALVGARQPFAGSLSGEAITQNASLICTDSEDDPRVNLEACRSIGARSLLVVPLRRGDTVPGVVKVVGDRPHQFTDEDRTILELLAAPFGAALTNAHSMEATYRQASTDPVTGLCNRAQATTELDRALLRVNRRGRHQKSYLAVFFIDLDRFKLANDTLGHAAGDRLLAAVAANIKQSVRGTDTAARFGGDEFIVICEDLMAAADVDVLARRLVDVITGTYCFDGLDLPTVIREPETGPPSPRARIGASIGVALTSASRPAADVLRIADEAMYQAKTGGGARYVVRDLDAG
jgi:diguanylate cyclase (GGDEF)-like protein/PAS domain S-box-containing protein